MIQRVMIGAVVVLLGTNLLLGKLWLSGREDLALARDDATRLSDSLAHAQEDARRAQTLADGLSNTLAVRETAYRTAAASLSTARHALSQIRQSATKENADANLACAVMPVPDAVDRLLRQSAPDDGSVSAGDAAGTPAR